MPYGFRVRLRFSTSARLPVDAPKLILNDKGHPRVWLISLNPDQLLRNATDAAIFGAGAETVADAESAGHRWKDIFLISCARLNIGVDFMERSANLEGGLSDEAAEILSQEHGHRVVNERPGVTVFEEPAPRFASFVTSGTVAPSVRRMEQTFVEAARLSDLVISDQERLAFDLYSASFFEESADARLLMLMMAVETLIERSPRSSATITLVNDFMKQIKNLSIPADEVTAMVSGLRDLRKESITQSGRKLANSLDGQKYMDRDPADFFTYCYKIRSRLVHGNLNKPTRLEVSNVAANLEMFTGHLLSRSLLYVTQEWADASARK